mgnify:CR=1 FL=1
MGRGGQPKQEATIERSTTKRPPHTALQSTARGANHVDAIASTQPAARTTRGRRWGSRGARESASLGVTSVVATSTRRWGRNEGGTRAMHSGGEVARGRPQ